MRIAIITDAWHPQVNGLVTTYHNLQRELFNLGNQVLLITPDGFHTFPCPTYPEIRLVCWPFRQLARRLKEWQPDCVHIATEGPLGHAARRFCLQQDWRFSSALHTQFPEYIRLRLPLSLSLGYRYLRWFHQPASVTMVPTASQQAYLQTWGFEHVEVCRHGVDIAIFQPSPQCPFTLPTPVMMYMGRVAVEKNIDAFLQLDLSGSQCVVGDGPDLERLKKTYPKAHFFGYRFYDELAAFLSVADVLVFPSCTDTFGLVMLEAMACGTPVAAYPVKGPLDVVQEGVSGCLRDNLAEAISDALLLSPQNCVHYARQHSWQMSAQRFLQLLITSQ